MPDIRHWLLAMAAALSAAAVPAQVLDQDKIAALHKAVRLNDVAAVRRYTAEPEAYLDARGERGYRPLQVAIRWGHTELYALLIEMGADVNATDGDGRSALHIATSNNDKTAVRLLLDSGAVVNQRDHFHYTPLHMAARSGHTDTAHLLIEAGADVNARIDVGFTAFDLAEAFPDLRDYLRQRGAKAGHELTGNGGN